MKKNIRRAGLGLVGLSALLLVQTMPASAEGVGQSNDIVGVGSDTIFIAANFLADGDNLGDLGFNAGSPQRRLLSIDPTGDALGRSTTLANPAASVVLRAGRAPVVRPNGSGAGIDFMNADKVAPFQVNFVRVSSPPTPAQQQTAVDNGWGGIHCYQFATDGLQMAVSNNSNAGGVLISAAQLVQIYSATGTIRKWSDLPGYSGPAPDALIKPAMPQSGSGTFKFFDAQLKLANNNTAVTYRSDVAITEEHDPTPIQGDVNLIAPFSTARKSVLDSGYFGASLQNTITMLNAAGAFSVTRPVYFLVRQNAVADHTSPTNADGIAFPFKGTQNWVEALFAGSTSFLGRATLARPLVQAAGFTYSYSDAGLCHS
jgi:ABC-type phosphate transport system substrate-binding protein